MADLTLDELAAAQQVAHGALAGLADLAAEALDALSHAGDAPIVDDLECDHSEPRLTDDEWRFVLDLHGPDNGR